MGESAAGTAHEAPWKEHVQATDGPRVLSFVGINQDQEDRFEVTRLASASTRKNRHLPGCLAQIVGFVAVFMWFGGRGNSEAAIFNMFFCLFMVAVGGPWVVGLWGWLASTPWKPEQSEVTGEFTLSISREELKLGGPGIDPAKRLAWPLVVIERFDGLQRLTLLRHDGGVESLPCRLPYGTHEGLAARLNAWLVDARETPATQTSQTHPSKKLT
jgi:hypothetical protein